MNDIDYLHRYNGAITCFMNMRNIPYDLRSEFRSKVSNDFYLLEQIRDDVLMSNDQKLQLIEDSFCRMNEVSIMGVLGNQGAGKDSWIFYFLKRLKKRFGDSVRICTLGTFALYPFVDEGDNYFLLEDVPEGDSDRFVVLFISELDIYFSQLSYADDQTKRLNAQINVFRQKKIKVIGGAKLAAQVALPFWRHCNHKVFKFISRDKLEYGERRSFFPDKYQVMMPFDFQDKSQIFYYNDFCALTATYPFPDDFTEEISQQYSHVTNSQIKAYAELLLQSGMDKKSVKTNLKVIFNFDM
jgi:hypothetical protein